MDSMGTVRMHKTFSVDETMAGSSGPANAGSYLASGHCFGGDVGAVETWQPGPVLPRATRSGGANLPDVKVSIDDG